MFASGQAVHALLTHMLFSPHLACCCHCRFGPAPSGSNTAAVPELFQRQLNDIQSLLTSMNAQRSSPLPDSHRASPTGEPVQALEPRLEHGRLHHACFCLLLIAYNMWSAP